MLKPGIFSILQGCEGIIIFEIDQNCGQSGPLNH